MRQKKVKIGARERFFSQEESAHRMFFSNKTHCECKFLPCYVKKKFYSVLNTPLYLPYR